MMMMWPAKFGNNYILKYKIKDEFWFQVPGRMSMPLHQKKKEVASRNVAREVMRIEVS